MRKLRSGVIASFLVALIDVSACAHVEPAPAAPHKLGASYNGGGGGASLPAGTGLVKVTSGVGSVDSTATTTVSSLAARWESAHSTFLAGKIPQLTEFQFACAANQPAAGPREGVPLMSAHDGAIEGGGWSASTAVNSLVHTQAVIQLPKTGKWGFSFRAKFAATAGGTSTFMGLVNGAATHIVDFGTAPTTDATHWMARVGAGTAISTTVRDTSIHDFDATSDGTTITLYLDGVSILTTAASGVNSDEPMYFWQYNTTHLDGVVTKYLIGYVAP